MATNFIFIESAESVKINFIQEDGVSLVIDGTSFYISHNDIFYLNNCSLIKMLGYDRQVENECMLRDINIS